MPRACGMPAWERNRSRSWLQIGVGSRGWVLELW